MSESAPAQLISTGPWEKPRKGAMVKGRLYVMSWRAPFTHGLTDLWRNRCREYWERIESRFGVVFSERRDAWSDDPVHGPCVTTMATVLLVLPGKRYEPRPSEEVH
jgi:hypothetical protein